MSLKTIQMKSLSLLSKEEAPRVFTPTMVHDYLKKTHAQLSKQSITQFLSNWVELGVIKKVKHGVYLNLRASPQPLLEEAAPWIRSGAIVSLQSVLGRSGVLNNPTDWVTCVYPYSKNPNHLELSLEGGIFRFSPMNDQAFPQKEDDWFEDAYEPFTKVQTATPEKALLDWIYLGVNGYRNTLPPPHDIDWEELNTSRLERLAEKMNLTEALVQFKNAVIKAEESVHLSLNTYKHSR